MSGDQRSYDDQSSIVSARGGAGHRRTGCLVCPARSAAPNSGGQKPSDTQLSVAARGDEVGYVSG